MNPMLASDAILDKIKFPCIIQPKIDGVRGMNLLGNFTGRSLKKVPNKAIQAQFSRPEYYGFDGEMAMNSYDLAHPDLCRFTTSAVNSVQGSPEVTWVVFDWITEDTILLPYGKRLKMLYQHINAKAVFGVRPILSRVAHSMDELVENETNWLDMGYEGLIIRDPNGMYKQGRSTAREGGLLRIKRFIETEAEVLSIIEGDTNENEAQTNELGRTFRSSHKENKVPNGTVGAMMCRMLNTVLDDKGEVLLAKGQIVKVGPGTMKHPDRKKYFEQQSLLVEHIVKFKFFPKGVKDKPRFPTYVTHRPAWDIGED